MRLVLSIMTALALAACSTPQKTRRQLNDGDVDREGIRDVIKSHEKQIKACYNTVLRSKPTLEGSIIVDFEIGQGGKVIRAGIDEKRSRIENAELISCLVHEFSSWTFPSPPENQVLEVSYPLYFTSN